MPIFSYKALNSSGGVSTGELDAADRPDALRMLDKRGLQPVNLKESVNGTVSSAAKNKASLSIILRSSLTLPGQS